MSQIVHLQTHSVYSFRRSLLDIEALVRAAAERGHRAVALTDTDGVYGMVPFVKAARKAGLKPLIGAELTLAIEALDH
ncbi:MAG TPA: PHP domain-containing protein, partial [Stenomitos sp.]